MTRRLNILYRGSLSSCNYGCEYCPFAKTANNRAELARDAAEVNRFVEWVGEVDRPIGVLFTPWGEAIIHRYYRAAMVRLSQYAHVERVSIQTNLSTSVEDLSSADRNKLALWVTFHPTETSIDRFLIRCRQLDELQIRYSIGVVGLHEHLGAIDELRERLPSHVYLWVNAYKRERNYYSDHQLERLREVDPYFDLNRHYYASRGKACGAGESSLTVDGRGTVRRCHFIDAPLGNIYEDDLGGILAERTCTNATCGCHIGYVHRPDLQLDQLYGENLLERIPQHWPLLDHRFSLTPKSKAEAR